MVLNKTNSLKIAEITGRDNTDHWCGAKLCLYATMVPFGAKMVEAIRIKQVPEPPVAATVQPAPAAPVTSVPTVPQATPAVVAPVANLPEPVVVEAVVAPANPQVDDDLADEIPWK